MSAIQASILSPTNNERRVAAVRSSSVSSASASSSLEQGGGRGRGREMLPEVAATSVITSGGCSTQLRRNSIDSSLSKLHPKRPVIDLAVAIIAIPTLVIFALMLETNLRENWAQTDENRWTVLGIGLGMIIVSLLLCGYVTHRMGVCLWAGPQDDSDSSSNFNRDPSSLDIYSIEQFPPPSYDSVIEYDNLSAPPPPYDCILHECIVVLDPTTASSGTTPETKKYPVTVQIIDEQLTTNYI